MTQKLVPNKQRSKYVWPIFDVVPNLIDCIWKVPKKEEAYFWSFNQNKKFPLFSIQYVPSRLQEIIQEKKKKKKYNTSKCT